MNDEQFDDLVATAFQEGKSPDLWPGVHRKLRSPWPTLGDLILYAAASVVALTMLGAWRVGTQEPEHGSWVAPIAMQPPEAITFDGRARSSAGD